MYRNITTVSFGENCARIRVMWFVFALAAAALWSTSDIVGSLLVQHHEKNPVVLTWIQSALGLVVLAVIALFIDVRSSWISSFFLAGICAYGGWLMFYYVLHRFDVSITTAAWGLNAIFISVASFVLFGESWSLLQSIGVAMVLGGVFFLSYFRTTPPASSSQHNRYKLNWKASQSCLLGWRCLPCSLCTMWLARG